MLEPDELFEPADAFLLEFLDAELAGARSEKRFPEPRLAPRLEEAVRPPDAGDAEPSD